MRLREGVGARPGHAGKGGRKVSLKGGRRGGVMREGKKGSESRQEKGDWGTD